MIGLCVRCVLLLQLQQARPLCMCQLRRGRCGGQQSKSDGAVTWGCWCKRVASGSCKDSKASVFVVHPLV